MLKTKEKILITASTFPRGKDDTVPDFIYKLAQDLSTNFEVYVLCPYSKGTKEYEEIDNIKIYRYKYLPWELGTLAYGGGILPKLKENKLYYLQVPFFLLFQLIAMAKIIKSHNIKVINACWLIPQGVIAVLYKKIFNNQVRVIGTALGGDIYGLKTGFGNFLRKFVIKNSDRIVAISTALKNKVLEYDNTKDIFLSHLGLDTEVFKPIDKISDIKENNDIKGDLLLFVGRVAHKKGLEYLIKAMPKILQDKPLTKLLVIGEGILKNDMIKLSKELNIEDNIIFKGWVLNCELPAYYSTADIFIGPSITSEDGDSEGMGLVFAEAMACGAIVISTDLAAISDVVIDNITGFTVNQKSADQISSKVTFILNNKDKMQNIKLNARQHIVDNFNQPTIIKKYELFLNEMMQD